MTGIAIPELPGMNRVRILGNRVACHPNSEFTRIVATTTRVIQPV
jgi:hypothetical protein